MQGFFFSLYMLNLFSVIGYSMTKNDLKVRYGADAFGFAVTYGLILSLAIFFSYFAGVFAYITGYTGNLSVFAVWIVFSVIGGLYQFFKSEYANLAFGLFGFFCLAMSGGLQNLAHLFG